MKNKEEMEKFIAEARDLYKSDEVKPELFKNKIKDLADELESVFKQLSEGYRPVEPR